VAAVRLQVIPQSETQSTNPDSTALPSNPAQQAAKPAETKPPEGSAAPPTSSIAEDNGSYVYKVEKDGGVTYPVPQAKNLFGANLDVVTSLDLVEFEQFGDGSMQNAIAYIVPWERGGTSNKTQSLPSFESYFRNGLLNDIAAGIGFGEIDLGDFDLSFDSSTFSPESFIDWNNVPSWNEDSSVWETTDLDLGIDYGIFDQKGKTNSAEQLTNAEERQKKLGSEIPIGVRQGLLTGLQFTNSLIPYKNSQVGNYVETGLNLIGNATDTPSGPVYIGNPAGVINQGLNLGTMFGFNIPGRGLTTSIGPDLQSSESKGAILKNKDGGSPGLPEGIWQFLFNPSELSLSVGPKYKSTDTWGVMDDANGGKPLHFTNLQNPELKFNKVLLNGYVFGRQVESLEQGLMELFMKNPAGNNPHGPQVLEFVWGKKTFGPCVIKDIQIKEKMWDNGLLVNAEVSFTLVKIPEWTINDGQVSVYDPSALPTTFGDPEITPGSASSIPPGSASSLPPAGDPGTDEPSPTSSDSNQGELTQLTAEEKSLYRKCQNAQNNAEKFAKISEKIKPSKNIFSSNITASKSDIRSAMNKHIKLYNSMKSKWGREFTGKITNPLAEPSALKRSVEIGLSAFKDLPDNRKSAEVSSIRLFVSNAADSGRNAMLAISKSARCKNVRAKADKITAQQKEQFKQQKERQEKQKRCNALRAGSPCSPLGSLSQTCGGTRIICGRNGFWQNSANYQ